MKASLLVRRSIVQRAVQAVAGISDDGLRVERFVVLALAVLALAVVCLLGYAPKRASRTISGGWWTPQSVHAQGGGNAPTFVTFDAKDAGTMMLQGTVATAINASGVIAGIYITMPNVAHGFVRASNGTITEFDAPNAGTGLNQGTFPTSIDAAGDIAGFYSDATVAYRGFVRSGANGMITEFDFPGAPTATAHRGTSPTGIDAAGDVSGFYRGIDDVAHGFLRTSNGTFTSFDVAAAGTSALQGTFPFSINSSGTITGLYRDASSVNHGFVGPAAGPFTTFDAPGAAGSSSGITKKLLCCGGTFALNIDAAGDVAGIYTDKNVVGHGFVRAANGTFTAPIDAPESITTATFPGTLVDGINASGVVLGDYQDASGALHGFVRAANGTFTSPLDATGAGTAGLGPLPGGTASLRINDSGVITGGYLDSSFVTHGFVLTPAPAAAPTFNPPAATYSSTQMVTLSDTTPGASIFFTTDGSTPTSPPTGTTAPFNGPISVASSETINAIAANPASWFSNSTVATAAYVINNNPPPPTPDFTVKVSPTTLTIVAGQSGMATFTVTPENGFNSPVGFTCKGLPSEAMCIFSPTSVTPSGMPVNTTLMVTTMAATSAIRPPKPPLPLWLCVLLLLVLATIWTIVARRRRGLPGFELPQFACLLVLLILAAGLASCNGGNHGNPGTPAGTTTASVSASVSGGAGPSHGASLTITITN